MRYHLQNVLTGDWIDRDFPLSAPEITRDLSGPSALTASLARGFADRASDLVSWQTAIYPEASGQLRGGFLVVGTDPQPDQLQVTCVGFAGYPQGMIWDGTYSSPDAGVDPLDVVRLIWDHLQAQPDGDLGVTVAATTTPIRLGSKAEFVKFQSQGGTVEFTAQDRYNLDWWNSTDCGQEIDSLATQTPFDYLERHYWAEDGSDAVTHEIVFGYPRIGNRRSDLRFVLGENLSAQPQPTHNETYGNQVIGLGAGEGASMLRATAGKRDGRLRRTVLLTEKDVRDLTRLRADVQRKLVQSQVLLDLSEVDVWDHKNAPLASIEPGDEIRVQADLGWTQIDEWHRITSITMQPESGDAAQLKLEAV